jgi:hypothetical protein
MTRADWLRVAMPPGQLIKVYRERKVNALKSAARRGSCLSSLACNQNSAGASTRPSARMIVRSNRQRPLSVKRHRNAMSALRPFIPQCQTFSWGAVNDAKGRCCRKSGGASSGVYSINFGSMSAFRRIRRIDRTSRDISTRRSATRSTPRTSVGKCGSIRAHCSSFSQNKFLRMIPIPLQKRQAPENVCLLGGSTDVARTSQFGSD